MKGEDVRQSKEYGKFMERLGWKVEKGMFIKKLPLFSWSFIKIQRVNWPVNWKEIERVRKKYRGVVVKIEPKVRRGEKEEKKIEAELKRHGYRRDGSPMLPTKTIWLDLRKKETELLKEMHYKTRYNIRKYGEDKRGKVEIIRGDKIREKELKGFGEVYRENARRQGFWGLNFNQLKSWTESLGKKSYWLLMRQEEKVVAGLIVLVQGKTAYYSHNGANRQGRRIFGPTVLAWEAIKLAKRLGSERFDFEGIEDERFAVTKKWRGFSKFKRGFGGEVVEYMGSFTKMGRL